MHLLCVSTKKSINKLEEGEKPSMAVEHRAYLEVRTDSEAKYARTYTHVISECIREKSGLISCRTILLLYHCLHYYNTDRKMHVSANWSMPLTYLRKLTETSKQR